MNLQEMFADAKGAPLVIDGESVIQMDRILIDVGKVTIDMRPPTGSCECGIAIKSAKGHILLSDGKKASLVHTWFDESLPDSVTYRVSCPDGESRIWNIYRIEHSSGQITDDSWTNNAGMVVKEMAERRRAYHCSDGLNNFSPDEPS